MNYFKVSFSSSIKFCFVGVVFLSSAFGAEPPATFSDFMVAEVVDFTKVKSADKPSSLSQLKDFEQSKKWRECRDLSAQILQKKQYPAIRPWILQTYALCTGRTFRESNLTKEALLKPYEIYEKDKSSFESSVAWKSLSRELNRNLATYIELAIKDIGHFKATWISKYYDLSEDREVKAKALSWSGEMAMSQHQFLAAENFFEQSLLLAEDKNNRDKLLSVRLSLNSAPNSKQSAKKEDLGNLKVDTLSEAEQKFDDRFKASIKNSDWVAFVEDAVTYLNRFPNGKRAKWAFEKVQDVYQNFLDKSSTDEKLVSLREKNMSQIERLEASRLLEFSRSLHRKGDFVGALRFSEKAYGALAQSPQAGLVLYLMGRSAQFIGEYSKAKKYFEEYVEFQSNGDEIGEVQFRLALVHFRLNNYSSVVAVLEKMLANRGAEKFDLLGRYWLVRALQSNKNPRAQEEARLLILKYPLSYYGLRLQAEQKSGVLDAWPSLKVDKASKLNSSKLYLTQFQKRIWDRVFLLGSNSWLAEASAEFAELSQVVNPVQKILMSRKLIEAHLYSPAIKMVMDSVDQDPELQSWDILTMALPDAYDEAIGQQARKQNLNPLLVRSLIRQESAFNERATSVSKAMGLMQLIPPTAQEVAQDLGLQGLELPQDSYLPGINIQMGTAYIAKMIKQFGSNVPMGLAAYNVGPTKMSLFVKARPEIKELTSRWSSVPVDELWFDELPWAETSFYVKAILRNTLLYRLRSREPVTLNPVLWTDLRLVQ